MCGDVIMLSTPSSCHYNKVNQDINGEIYQPDQMEVFNSKMANLREVCNMTSIAELNEKLDEESHQSQRDKKCLEELNQKPLMNMANIEEAPKKAEEECKQDLTVPLLCEKVEGLNVFGRKKVSKMNSNDGVELGIFEKMELYISCFCSMFLVVLLIVFNSQ